MFGWARWGAQLHPIADADPVEAGHGGRRGRRSDGGPLPRHLRRAFNEDLGIEQAVLRQPRPSHPPTSVDSCAACSVGLTSGGEPGFHVRVGVIAERLPQVGPSLLVEEEMLDLLW